MLKGHQILSPSASMVSKIFLNRILMLKYILNANLTDVQGEPFPQICVSASLIECLISKAFSPHTRLLQDDLVCNAFLMLCSRLFLLLGF